MRNTQPGPGLLSCMQDSSLSALHGQRAGAHFAACANFVRFVSSLKLTYVFGAPRHVQRVTVNDGSPLVLPVGLVEQWQGNRLD